MPFYGSSSYKKDFKDFKVLNPSYEAYSQSLSKAPRVKFEGQSAYKDQYKGFKVESGAGRGGKACVLDGQDLPQTNFLNSSPHVYFDEASNKFM